MPMAPIGHNGGGEASEPLHCGTLVLWYIVVHCGTLWYIVVLCRFQSEHCSLDSDYNGMQAVSSVTAPGASDGQVEEKEEKVEKEEGKPPKTQPRIR